jgi:glucosamine--fructose-6-phosphate aminotransferase (isomerizing)
MCGIIGYISKNPNPLSIEIGIESLKRLEYRGYDSAGLAYWDDATDEIVSFKSVGRIANLESLVHKGNAHSSNPIILHTRWATHGEVSEENAHPHHDCKGNIWLVHNGIIENGRQLREQLEAEGHQFVSETDTEVLTHLIEKYYLDNLVDAVRKALRHVIGTYGLAVISRNEPDKIIAARLSSPLLIGVGNDCFYLSSDPIAIASYTKKVVYLDDGELAIITKDDFTIIREKIPEEIDTTIDQNEKAGYPHFMLKEIMEQPRILESSLKGRLDLEDGNAQLGGLQSIIKDLFNVRNIYIVACGTARHAGLLGELYIEELAGILCKTEAASEFRYKNPILSSNSAVLAISQSGETADTLAAIREAKTKKITTIGITNVIGSTQARETDAGVYTRAGIEIGVASTKAFTAQVLIMVLVALKLGRHHKLSISFGQEIVRELRRIPILVEETLKTNDTVLEIAQKYVGFNNFLYLGRKYSYPIAREGAHKIKETAYIHAEGCRGGEPKHCELALISEKFPSVCIVPNDSVYDKMISNIEEIKARKGPIIAIATEGNHEISSLVDDVIYIPKTLEMLTPILSIIPLQLFAYHMAVLRGCDVDKPRNLAKSVTVE